MGRELSGYRTTSPGQRPGNARATPAHGVCPRWSPARRGTQGSTWGAARLCPNSAAGGCGPEAPGALLSALEASHLNQNRSWEWCSTSHPEAGLSPGGWGRGAPFTDHSPRLSCITSRGISASPPGSCGYRHFTDEETDAAQPSQSDPRRKWQGWGQDPVGPQHPLSGGRGEDWLGPWASLGAAAPLQDSRRARAVKHAVSWGSCFARD